MNHGKEETKPRIARTNTTRQAADEIKEKLFSGGYSSEEDSLDTNAEPRSPIITQFTTETISAPVEQDTSAQSKLGVDILPKIDEDDSSSEEEEYHKSKGFENHRNSVPNFKPKG